MADGAFRPVTWRTLRAPWPKTASRIDAAALLGPPARQPPRTRVFSTPWAPTTSSWLRSTRREAVVRVRELAEREVVGLEIRVGARPASNAPSLCPGWSVFRVAVVGARVEVARGAGGEPVAAELHVPEQRLAEPDRRRLVRHERWRGSLGSGTGPGRATPAAPPRRAARAAPPRRPPVRGGGLRDASALRSRSHDELHPDGVDRLVADPVAEGALHLVAPERRVARDVEEHVPAARDAEPELVADARERERARVAGRTARGRRSGRRRR